MVLPLPPPLRHRQPPITPESLAAAIPEPDQRPPLTAATNTAATLTQQHRQQLIETTPPPDHAAQISNNTTKITATLAATIPETSPAASLDDLTPLLDNAAAIG